MLEQHMAIFWRKEPIRVHPSHTCMLDSMGLDLDMHMEAHRGGGGGKQPTPSDGVYSLRASTAEPFT